MSVCIYVYIYTIRYTRCGSYRLAGHPFRGVERSKPPTQDCLGVGCRGLLQQYSSQQNLAPWLHAEMIL